MTRPDAGELRRQLRAKRRAVPEAQRAAAARRIAEHLLACPELAGPGRIATFLPSDGEVDPNAALPQLRSRGWEPHLPVVGEDSSMTFAPWVPDDTLAPNRYGIPEPSDHRAPRRTAADLDVILVPCVGLDTRGNRLGFGVGFYDRALGTVPSARRPLLVGVAFELSIVDELVPDPWDVPVDVVVTERRVVRTGAERPVTGSDQDGPEPSPRPARP